LPGLPAGSPAASLEVIKQVILAREVAPETVPWMITLARAKAKSMYDAHRCNWEKGESRPETWNKHRTKWLALIADLDAIESLASPS
jgi:hypothetical protein